MEDLLCSSYWSIAWALHPLLILFYLNELAGSHSLNNFKVEGWKRFLVSCLLYLLLLISVFVVRDGNESASAFHFVLRQEVSQWSDVCQSLLQYHPTNLVRSCTRFSSGGVGIGSERRARTGCWW